MTAEHEAEVCQALVGAEGKAEDLQPAAATARTSWSSRVARTSAGLVGGGLLLALFATGRSAALRGAARDILAEYDETCLHMGKYYDNGDDPLLSRTVQASPSNCLQHCKEMMGCAFFSFWPDGGCILQNSSAGLFIGPEKHNGVISGPVTCGDNMDTAAALGSGPDTIAGIPGTVYAIYTYGGTGTAKTPLPDLSQASKNFRGLRTYTETIRAGSRSTDVGAIFDGMEHPRVATLALHWQKDSEYWPGEGAPSLPKHGDETARAADISLHNMKNYFDRFAHLQLPNISHPLSQPRFAYAEKYAYLAWGAYETQKLWVSNKEITMEEIIKRFVPGNRLVAQVQENTLEAVDNMYIVQDEQTLDCALVFEGTHTFGEFFSNLKMSSKGTGYCGFSGVHDGYVGKIWWLMKYGMPKLRPSLKKCAKVSCTGHSLGGALCDIFAACANSGRTDNLQYKNQMWTKGTPELMPKMRQLKPSR
eukprot:TRINITY_DN42070_c0_g1_i1.p1 TRINITY_DN42070_c0_g1~~TRINITY_DN42070_c0_g1_i1.p1  ORF type:complete len:477 (+),score=95.75 TRINITY_DN42070_c0_g1_i1:60-1490(+)